MWDYLFRWYVWCNCLLEKKFGFNKNWFLFGGNIDVWLLNGIKLLMVVWVYKIWFKVLLFICYCVKWKMIYICISLLYLVEVLNVFVY